MQQQYNEEESYTSRGSNPVIFTFVLFLNEGQLYLKEKVSWPVVVIKNLDIMKQKVMNLTVIAGVKVSERPSSSTSHNEARRSSKEREVKVRTEPRDYKTFFMLTSTEHEIFPAHKC